MYIFVSLLLRQTFKSRVDYNHSLPLSACEWSQEVRQPTKMKFFVKMTFSSNFPICLILKIIGLHLNAGFLQESMETERDARDKPVVQESEEIVFYESL